jgi:hypothetical protein
MDWKFYFLQNSKELSKACDTKEQALNDACRMHHSMAVEIVRIEGPNGVRIEREKILEECAARIPDGKAMPG